MGDWEDVAQDVEIKLREDVLVNLTKAWRASKTSEGKQPRHWLELSSTKQFIETVSKKVKVGKSDLLVPERGKFGGTFAHWQIFLAYAKYLSPEFHMWANQVVKKRFGKTADPDLFQ